MFQRATVLDVARQPLWRYVKGRHRSCDTRGIPLLIWKNIICSGTPRVVTARVPPFDVPPQGLSRNITTCLQVFGSERHVQNNYTSFFPTKRWKCFFAIYVVRLALYVCLKNICDGVGGQDELNGTHLDPPLFWPDNIFKRGFHNIQKK
jgi:hypothetical protein